MDTHDVVFQLIKGILAGYSSIAFLTTPAPMMWYLFALVIWRSLYYLWTIIVKQRSEKQRITLNIIVAVVLVGLGLAVGLFCQVGKVFALSRIIVFSPFFWLGTMSQEFDFIGFCKKIPCWIAVLILVSTLSFIIWLTPQEWLNVRETVRCVSCYDMLGGTMIGLAGRTVYYILAIVISIALTNLIFENKVVCRVGKNSLKYYLLHGVLLIVLSYFNVPLTLWLSIVFFVIIMVSLYFFNMTKLSDFAIRPFHFINNTITKRKK